MVDTDIYFSYNCLVLAFQESIINVSKITDILLALLLSVVVCVMVLVYLGEHPYYLILAVALSVVINAIYIPLKIRSGKPPAPPPPPPPSPPPLPPQPPSSIQSPPPQPPS